METEREYLNERVVRELRCESAGDYTLPDYNTDVRRILMSTADAVSAGAYVGGDGIESSGVVNYRVVYLDSEGEITSCTFSVDYELCVKLSGDEAEAIEGCMINTSVALHTVRLIGPRRLSVKSQLESNLSYIERKRYSIDGDAFASHEPQVKEQSVKVSGAVYSTPTEKEFSGELCSLDGVIADEVSVLYEDAVPELRVTRNDDGVSVTGRVLVRALVRRDGELPSMCTLEIPISEDVVIDGVGADSELSVSAKINSLKTKIEPNEDGVKLLTTVRLEYSVRAAYNSDLAVVLDAYLTDAKESNSYRELNYTRHVRTISGKEDVSVSMPMSELTLGDVRDFLICTATFRADSFTPSSDTLKVEGICRISGVACEINEDSELGFTGVKKDIPVSFDVKNSSHIAPGTRISGNFAVINPKIMIGEGECTLEFTASYVIDASLDGAVECLSSSVVTDADIERDEAVVTVYFPSHSESLFDVGRKFRTSTISIAADNSLTEEVFSNDGSDLKSLGVDRLIIR